jgi:hypothetical protein
MRIQLALIIPVLALSACKKEKKPVPEPATPEAITAAPSTTDTQAKPAPAASAPPKLTLLEAGSEPRQRLVFVPKAGDVADATMTITMATEVSMGGGQANAVQPPPMIMKMRIKVEEVMPNGDIRYTMTIPSAELGQGGSLPSQALGPLEKNIKAMTGVSGGGLVSNRGVNKSLTMNLPADLDPQMRDMMKSMEQSMTQMMVPLPEEAVGLGAKWKADTALNMNGLVLEQVANFEVVELAAGRMKAKVAVEQKANAQTVTQNGVTFRLDSLQSEGTGEMEVALNRVMPVKSVVKVVSNMAMSDPRLPGQSMKMKLDMEMSLAE